jgi:ATP-binding cassette subfamily B protein RaxB
MVPQQSLFRQEAIEFQRHHRQWGEVALQQPLPSKVLTWFFTGAVVLAVVFVSLAQYARKETVVGYLSPTSGTVRIFAPRQGTIEAIHVQHGHEVREGQPLLTIAANEVAADGEDINTAKLETLTRQKELLLKQIAGEEQRTASERDRLSELSKGLELTPTETFSLKDERQRLPFGMLWARTRGSTHAVVQILVLSALLALLTIAGPFYLQLAIDEVVARGDIDLLVVLAVGFGLLTLITVASTAIRSFVVLILQNTLHFQIGARLFHHLLRLPIAFFEKRHVGDILSRFTSIEPIQNQLAENLITGVIDGLMALVMLAMIFAYSVKLAFVVLGAFLLYAVLRLALYQSFRRRSQAVIESQAREHSTFIETARAMQSLKLFNRESEREAQWLNRYADFVNATVRLGRARINFKTLNDAIFGLENIVTVYLAARLTIDGTMTIGMIFAFMSYKRQFLDKTAILVEKGIDFRLLDLHLERLADIALHPLEKGHDRPLAYARPIRGGIELRNVWFRYAETEPFILEDISLSIRPGQFVTIMGPSGGGKTTLVKVMLGLLEPTSGEVLIDGVPLSTIGPRGYRENVGAVMQEDQLLSGSIADNICFFDASFDVDRMVECAKLAGVHDEIMAMPMTYNSLIGDMGSSLSGGQKQRVLLARALYRQPKILFLDEGTAHLDVDRERHINESLRRLEMTRISVAHRPEISGGADAIVRIDNSRASLAIANSAFAEAG